MTYQATLQVNNAIVFNDFTMQPHFRDYMLRVDVAIVTVEAGIVSASGTAAWGGITGTLSAQTDLQTALNGKANSLGSDDNYVTDAEKVVIGNTSGTNTGDNAVNSLYSGLVSNATHTGDATGATALSVVKIQGTAIPAPVAGDDGKFVKYDHGTTAFVYDTASGGGGGGATATITAKHVIQTITNASAGEFDFDSIPAGYDRLIIEGFLRGDVSAISDNVRIFFNADTTLSNYHEQASLALNNANSSAEATSSSRISFVPAASSPANSYANISIVIEDYDGSNRKGALSSTYSMYDTAATLVGFFGVKSSITDAITRVRIRTDNHATDQLLGTLTLYGEKQTTLGGGTPTPVDNATTPYTLALADAYTCQRFTAASPAVTIPTNAAVAYPIGTEIYIRQAGTGTLTLTTTGLTINGTVPTWAQHVEVKFRKVATDTWDVA